VNGIAVVSLRADEKSYLCTDDTSENGSFIPAVVSV
jgi:hypothetical protein